MGQARRRTGGLLALAAALLLGSAPARAAFDPGYEARNFSKTTERATHLTLLPDYQQQLRTVGTANELQAAQILATDGPPTGRTFLGQLCWQHMDGCAGDTRLYDWAARYGHVTPVLFTARNGATLSGHVWATVAGPARRPGVVITNGSVQAPEELYWFAAETLAKAGYVVMTWDPQGQGYSDTVGEGPDALDGVPSQNGQPFYDGTEDALDFFFSGPGAPYVPRRSCSTGTDHAAKQRARVTAGLDSAYNPMHDLVDFSRVGLVGHSLGAGAVSYIGQLDPRVRTIVAYDNLSAPKAAPFGCRSGSSPRPVPALTKPALGLSADYGLTPQPNLSEPVRGAKSAGSRALAAAGVDSAEFVIRGGTHYEFSFIPNPAFGASLRGEDLVSWYTTAWLDKYLKGSDPTADARLLTDRWRADAAEGAIDPDHDGNLYSRYSSSPLDVHTAAGMHVVCEDARAACPALRPDGGPVPYSFLAAANTPDAAPGPGTPAALTGPSTQAPAGAAGTPPGATGPQALRACRDTTAPVSRLTRSRARLTRRGLRLAGTSTDAGCDGRAGATTGVSISVARLVPGRAAACRFLRPDGRLSPVRSCARTSYLPATGTARWTFTRRVRLPAGRYRVYVRGVDAAGNVERKARGRTDLRLRLR
ncbi:hypothetical protein NBH00_09225 [Paraconexibacter antarcticus]|uniref:Alpha/beta hydrolase family protein n=1 Tax=Paraconexibacter antarcticus TaxID=2949664 RepID=A0ABY5DZJ5_9ACTN|nr:hypothetical protein [Paraconexibacter antarcticus]UTI66374.1 hypothetical protein NBH00_09225 [Paraconexibacter antarcticus]